MTKLEISISSTKYSIECSDEEIEIFKEITKSLNQKSNELMMRTGKISDLLLMFILLLINTNKELGIFNNFQENISKLIKNISPLLILKDEEKIDEKESLSSKLLFANIIKENEISGLEETTTAESTCNNFKETTAAEANIGKEASSELQEKDLVEIVTKNSNSDELENLKQENQKNSEETIKFIDEITELIEKLANNINMM